MSSIDVGDFPLAFVRDKDQLEHASVSASINTQVRHCEGGKFEGRFYFLEWILFFERVEHSLGENFHGLVMLEKDLLEPLLFSPNFFLVPHGNKQLHIFLDHRVGEAFYGLCGSC